MRLEARLAGFERDELLVDFDLLFDGAMLTSYLQKVCKVRIKKKENHCQVLLSHFVNLPLKWD